MIKAARKAAANAGLARAFADIFRAPNNEESNSKYCENEPTLPHQYRL
jgi:hypothetical protein